MKKFLLLIFITILTTVQTISQELPDDLKAVAELTQIENRYKNASLSQLEEYAETLEKIRSNSNKRLFRNSNSLITVVNFRIIEKKYKVANLNQLLEYITILEDMNGNTDILSENRISNLLDKCVDFLAVKHFEENFALVKAGSFYMGSNSGAAREKPVHKVIITEDFYIGKYEVTQKEWESVLANNPSHFKGDNLPVDSVSWYEAIEYCNKLSIKEGLIPAYTGSGDNIQLNENSNGYRLPTEAQWEFAAKGGKQSKGYKYSGSNRAFAVAWNGDNSRSKTHNVGTKSPNELGIYDMSGNVWEWCFDWYGDYSRASQRDPKGSSAGSYRVRRGGSWYIGASVTRVANRSYSSPGVRGDNLGFRVALPVQ